MEHHLENTSIFLKLFLAFGGLSLSARPALACDYPDEGNMPLRRAVTKSPHAAGNRSLERRRAESRCPQCNTPLLLEQTRHSGGRCY